MTPNWVAAVHEAHDGGRRLRLLGPAPAHGLLPLAAGPTRSDRASASPAPGPGLRVSTSTSAAVTWSEGEAWAEKA